MAKKENLDVETSIVPLKYVDLIEDIFHAVLALALFEMGLNAGIVVALVFAIFLSKSAHRR
jgi:hypothetical protein